MKQITIDDKIYNIDCNAFTFVKYKSIFKTGILKDMQTVQNYLIRQTVVADRLDKKGGELGELSDYMIDFTDEFITKITQIAWILIYTADNKIVEYEQWLKSMKKLDISADWIAEVTEFAVDCFC